MNNFKAGDRVRVIGHDPDEAPTYVGREGAVRAVGKGVRVILDGGHIGWFWPETLEVISDD